MQFNIKKSQTYDKNSFKVDLFSLLVWFPAELETCAEELCHVLHNVHVVIKMMMAFDLQFTEIWFWILPGGHKLKMLQI